MKRVVVALGLLALVTLPRVVDLGRPGLTYDEFYDIEDSERFCREGGVFAPISDGYLNGQAPFFLACGAYRLFGWNETSARGLAMAAGLLTVLATFLLARRFLPARWALLAALLLGLAPFFLAASRLAFSHGHVFAVPWLILALRETLASRTRLRAPRPAWAAGLLAGAAAGSDLLAVPWAATLLVLAWRRLRGAEARPRRTRFLVRFGVAWAAGLALTSPMYVANPVVAAYDVAARLRFWDAQQEHFWLGAEVEALPWYYYALVLLVRLSPPVLVLVLAGLVRPGPAARVCLPCLWPIALLTLKSWKSPFYLTPFLPLLFVVAAASLRRLARGRGPRLARGAALVVIAVQGAEILDSHPDHLMGGIRYGARFYGDFAGPAVSHGQWVLEALEQVRRDAGRGDVFVVVPVGYAPRQVGFYAERLGLSRVHTADQLRHGLNPRQVDYVVVSHDVPAHQEGRQQNRALLRLADDTARFRELAGVRRAGFPMARIWKRRTRD